jgi:hypothetical protein
MSRLIQASKMMKNFKGESLRRVISGLQEVFKGATSKTSTSILVKKKLTKDLLSAAILVKKNASQIDEIVHALGIMLVLPNILEEGEIVESLSLAAGNTGKGFDLKTTKRIAEFTFIQWKGGPETVRQNKVFKDFFFLAEAKGQKKRQLYIVGTEHVQKFFNSSRSIEQILKGNAKLGESYKKLKKKYETVRDYYQANKHKVEIVDICNFNTQFRMYFDENKAH